MTYFSTIDIKATGKNIDRLRLCSDYSIHDLQQFFGFTTPQAIYNWINGKSLPSIDNLYALGALLNISLDDILIGLSVMDTTSISSYSNLGLPRKNFGTNPRTPILYTILRNGRILAS